MRLVHLSDLHFGTESQEALDALTASLNSLAPDVLVVSGDLTQRARRREFLAARHYLDTFERPFIVVPGNHDIPLFNPLKRALQPFAPFRDVFGDTDTTCVTYGPARLIALNSVRRERHTSGRIGDRQRQEIAALARQSAPGCINIVIVHHPLDTVNSRALHRRRDSARDAQTCRAWQAAGIHLVLSGHDHRPTLHPAATNGSAGDPGIWLLGAGTAISRRLRHEYPNTFNVIDIPDAAADEPADLDSIKPGTSTIVGIERWDHAPGEQRFTCHERREISLLGSQLR